MPKNFWTRETKRKKKKEEEQKREEPDEVRGQSGLPRGGGGGGLSRMRRRRAADHSDNEDQVPAQPEPNNVEDPQEDPDEDKEEKGTVPMQARQVGKKKLRKLQEKDERAKAREAQEAAKKARLEAEDRDIAERKKKHQKEQDQARQEEEDLERMRQERKKREEEEFNLLKQSFEVESSGSHMAEREAFENNLEEFVNYIKQSKVVYLEDLAVKYQLQPKDVVEKIEMLEQEGKLSGIMDERGKFIYITPEEMTNIAKFITQRGRVTIAEIARESNKLINLTPQVTNDVSVFEQ